MKWWLVLPVVAFAWNVLCASSLEVGNVFPSFDLGDIASRFEKGREEITKLQKQAKLPQGSCWKAALEDLQVLCKDMSPEVQSRLALQFTTCYNMLLGFPPIICERRTPLPDCMRNLDDSSRSTFREFFLHTQDMCYFIEHQMWQDKTSEAVNGVTNAVVDVTKTLEETQETQEKVLQSQKESLQVQSDIIRDNGILHNMVMNFKEVFDDVQASAMEQRQVFTEIFDKLSRMQKLVSWIQGEMSLLDMMGFYFTCIVFGFFGTASERTHKARFWIVVLMILTLGLERFVFNQLNASNNHNPEEVQEWIWVLRRIAAIFGVIVIAISAAWYRDPQTVQKNMIDVFNKRLDKILDKIEGIKRREQLVVKSILDVNEDKILQEENDAETISDSDSISNYTSDSESDIFDVDEPKFAKKKEVNYNNDENKIPDADSSMINRIFGQVTASRAREISVDRSTLNGSRHQYNLRKRTPSESPNSILQVESPSAFAKNIKKQYRKPMANRQSMYFSSDDDL